MAGRAGAAGALPPPRASSPRGATTTRAGDGLRLPEVDRSLAVCEARCVAQLRRSQRRNHCLFTAKASCELPSPRTSVRRRTSSKQQGVIDAAVLLVHRCSLIRTAVAVAFSVLRTTARKPRCGSGSSKWPTHTVITRLIPLARRKSETALQCGKARTDSFSVIRMRAIADRNQRCALKINPASAGRRRKWCHEVDVQHSTMRGYWPSWQRGTGTCPHLISQPTLHDILQHRSFHHAFDPALLER